MIWTNIFSNQTIIRLYQQLMDFLKNGTVKTQESAEAIVSRVVDSGGVFLNNIPQEKRQIATGLYVQLCSKVRSSIGDVKADVISNYIFESALAAWLRKAAQSASWNHFTYFFELNSHNTLALLYVVVLLNLFM